MQQNEQLSAYVDGYEADAKFIEALCDTPALQEKWASYHLARDVLREESIILGADFTKKMTALLENEQIEKPKKGRIIQLKRWATPLMQAGIAASVCLIAVIGVNHFNRSDDMARNEQPVLQTLPFSNSVQQVSYNAPVQSQPNAEQLEYQQRRINALLQDYELQRRIYLGGSSLTEEPKSKVQLGATEATPQ